MALHFTEYGVLRSRAFLRLSHIGHFSEVPAIQIAIQSQTYERVATVHILRFANICYCGLDYVEYRVYANILLSPVCIFFFYGADQSNH